MDPSPLKIKGAWPSLNTRRVEVYFGSVGRDKVIQFGLLIKLYFLLFYE